MAKCWECSVPAGGKYTHCGRCDCCRPMVRPSGGGGGGDKSGCALWTFAPLAAVLILAFLGWLERAL